MSRTTRRTLVGSTAAGMAMMLAQQPRTLAHQATPVSVTSPAPSFATARVRTQPSPELNQAIYPDVMASLVPPTMALPGFLGYTFVFDNDDPATAIIFSTMDDSETAENSQAIAQEYVGQLDPRFVTETPLSADGRVRMYATTSTPPEDRAPFLHGTSFTLRDQTNAPGVDIDNAVAIAQETLVPLFLEQPGFVLYCWFERPGGRVAVNIWETATDLEAADAALANWRDEHFTEPTASETTTYSGTVGYSTMAGLT